MAAVAPAPRLGVIIQLLDKGGDRTEQPWLLLVWMGGWHVE